MLLISVVGTFLAFVLVLLHRQRLQRELPSTIGMTRKKFRGWPPVITVILIVLVFTTIWIFYWKDGIDGANTAWAFGGPIIGSLCGYWFGKPS